jgi:hypothetical protein
VLHLQAVIGAGAAGLVAARELRKEGHEVVVFEQQEQLGGTWLYTDQVGCGISVVCIYATLHLSMPSFRSLASWALLLFTKPYSFAAQQQNMDEASPRDKAFTAAVHVTIMLQVESDLLGQDAKRRRVHSSMYQGLTTNLPRQIMGYSDFPFSPSNMAGHSIDNRHFPCSEEVCSHCAARYHAALLPACVVHTGQTSSYEISAVRSCNVQPVIVTGQAARRATGTSRKMYFVPCDVDHAGAAVSAGIC